MESVDRVQILDEATFHFVQMQLGKVWIHLLVEYTDCTSAEG